MLRLQIVSTAGEEVSLAVSKIISVDNVPWDKFQQSEPDSTGLQNRVVMLEQAVASIVAQWNEFMNTAQIIGEDISCQAQSSAVQQSLSSLVP